MLLLFISCLLVFSILWRKFSCFFINDVDERPWGPIQSANNGKKERMKGEEEREIKSSLLILDLKKDGKFQLQAKLDFK